MNFFYSALIVVGLISGSMHAMDQEPALISELVFRSGYPDLDFDSLCSMALVCKQWSAFTVQHVRCLLAAREKVLENDYNKRLQENQFDRGALLTLRKDRLAYGFIGVQVLEEENCAHDEFYQLWLWRVKFQKYGDTPPSHVSTTIVKTWGNPEPTTEKYPWIENFKNPKQRALWYLSDEKNSDPISINKPSFKSDGDLVLKIDKFKFSDGPMTIAELFSSRPWYTCRYTINNDGMRSMSVL
jgi:hypothetical protein